MKATEKEDIRFTVTDQLKGRASELLDESQAMQFAEGLRLNNAAAIVFDREQRRLEKKYGKDDQRTKDMALRAEASATVKAELFSRYTDAITPPPKPEEGWSVDGFVCGLDRAGLAGLTVAAYDKQENRLKEFGQATTDERGYFTITVEELPEKLPKQVFMRASKGKILLPSNEVSLSPEPGGVERVEIILRANEKDPKPVYDKTPDKPADKPVVVPVEKPPVVVPVEKPPVVVPANKPPDKPVVGPADKPVVGLAPKDKPVEPAKSPALPANPVIARQGATTERMSSAGSKRKAKATGKKASGRAGTKKRSK